MVSSNKMSSLSIVVLIVTLASGGCLTDHRGTEFILTFNFKVKDENAVLVFISEKATNVHISSSHKNFSKYLSLTSNSKEKLSLNDSFSLNETSLEVFAPRNTGIYVTSTEKMTLYAYAFGYYSSSGFLVLPVNGLSMEYIAVTYLAKSGPLAWNWNVISVVATEDNTFVNITLPKSETLNCIPSLSNNGDVLVVEMNKLDVIGIPCKEDLTGTIIRSNKNIVVLSGNTFAAIGSTKVVWDAIQEMLIPTAAYGFTHQLHSFDDDIGVEHRIVSGSYGNLITTSSGEVLSLEFAEFHTLETNLTETKCISCSRPCMVMTFGKRYKTETSAQDALMTLTPAMEHYLYDPISSYLAPSLKVDVKMSLIFNANYSDQLPKLDEIYVSLNIGGCNDAAYTIAGIEMTSSIGELPFPRGQIVRGVGPQTLSTYGHPTGLNLDVDDCKVNECLNGGTCEDQFYGFLCHCVDGFNGTRCENDMDECLSNQCQNNAFCQDDINGFVCQCKPGFNGTLCENVIGPRLSTGQGLITQSIDINECLSSPCQNNASCLDNINGFVCLCTPGFNGTICENDMDECLSNQCQNNAFCQDDINGFVCQCKPGFIGTLCENDIDECLSNPCQNNATCRDDTDQFVCQCKPGFSGLLCEKDVDECPGNPCENAGTCQDIPGGFVCHCETGFYGVTCENVGFVYTYTRLISVDKTLVTSTGEIVTDVPLETDIRFETSYTTPLVIQNTPGDNGHSDYDCVCTRYGNSSEEVDQKVLIDKIQDDLLLDKNKLLKTIIKYKTMEDDRPSARGIGSVGCIFIIVSTLLVVVPDIFYLLRQCENKEKKVKEV